MLIRICMKKSEPDTKRRYFFTPSYEIIRYPAASCNHRDLWSSDPVGSDRDSLTPDSDSDRAAAPATWAVTDGTPVNHAMIESGILNFKLPSPETFKFQSPWLDFVPHCQAGIMMPASE